ncbi:hypothetical protein FB451DRAFT_1194143 [Mycena latifolia]|nr:hypothetical protein FB451DRAFT_1194143 [Mycena latifolia]
MLWKEMNTAQHFTLAAAIAQPPPRQFPAVPRQFPAEVPAETPIAKPGPLTVTIPNPLGNLFPNKPSKADTQSKLAKKKPHKSGAADTACIPWRNLFGREHMKAHPKATSDETYTKEAKRLKKLKKEVKGKAKADAVNSEDDENN